MQFSQPGFTQFGQPFAYNPPYHYNQCPDVVGEGNVTSVMAPDGNVQFLFLPTAQWWRPGPWIPNIGNANPNIGAWLVRSILNPFRLQQTTFGTPFPVPLPYPRHVNSDTCVEMPASYQLKFHNDNCTSTSDIHYFYPGIRHYDWYRNNKACVAVQVDSPVTTNNVCHYEVFCNKPCHCSPNAKTTEKIECKCKTSDVSLKSVSASNSENNCCKKGTDKSEKNKCHKSEQISPCKCREKLSDKCVTTYTDQASACIEEKGCETQVLDAATFCGGSDPCKKDTVKSKKSKVKTVKIKQFKYSKDLPGTCESGCCSSGCSCHSDTS